MKRLAAVFGVCLTVVLGGITFAAGSSSATLARIVENQEVRIGMSGNQPPFTMKARSGNLIGFEVDAANALAAAMGVKLKLVQKPFADLLPALGRGEVDLVMSGMTMTPGAQSEVQLRGSVLRIGQVGSDQIERAGRAQRGGCLQPEGLDPRRAAGLDEPGVREEHPVRSQAGDRPGL